MSSSIFLKKKRPNHNGIPLIQGKTEAEFVAELKGFHASRSTPFTSIPLALGRQISLLKLFNVVASKGGFEKVSQRKLWPDVIKEMHLPAACSNIVYALRTIYLRFLDSFEKARDPAARHDATEEVWLEAMGASDASMRRRLGLNTLPSVSALNVVPMVHRGCKRPPISLEVREATGLSCEVNDPRAYRLLELSLLSGLPNEVDVVLNSILLLSARGALDIMQNPNILNLLLATVGIYDTGASSYYHLHEDWFNQSRRNFFRYWYENVDDPEFRVYLCPDAITNDSVEWVDSDSENRRRAMDALFNHSMVELEDSLTEADVVGSRVESVATIIRNLLVDSVDQLGAPSAINCLASCSSTILRFAILATGHSRDPGIHRLGLELLSILRPAPVVRSGRAVARHYGFLLGRYLVRGGDRAEKLRGLEILTRVCESALFCKDPGFAHPLLGIEDGSDAKKGLLAPADILAAAVDCLLLRDLHLLITGLESLLALSCLDEVVCRHMCQPVLSVIPILVALLTLEAPSLGQDSLLRVRIFQPVPPPPAPHLPYYPPPHTSSLPHQQVAGQSSVRVPPPPGYPPQPPQYYVPRAPLPSHATGARPAPTSMAAAPTDVRVRSSRPAPASRPPAEPPIPPSRRSLRFVSDWLRSSFTATEHARISRLQMYAEYRQAHCAQFTGSSAQLHTAVDEAQFFELVKENFPNIEETKLVYPNGSEGIVYINIGHANQTKPNGHPPNGVRHGLAPPHLPCPPNLPPSPPGSSDGPLTASSRALPNSTARLGRAPPTPPHSPNHTPPPAQPRASVQSEVGGGKAHVRQCIRNSLLERSRRLKERSLQGQAVPTYEMPKRPRMEESTMLVAGPAEVHGAVTMPDQVTLKRVPNPKSPAPASRPPQTVIANGAPALSEGLKTSTNGVEALHPQRMSTQVTAAALPGHHQAMYSSPNNIIYNRHLNARLQQQAFNSLWVKQLPPMFNLEQPKVDLVITPGTPPSAVAVPPINGFRKPHPPPPALLNGNSAPVVKKKKVPEEKGPAAKRKEATANGKSRLVNGEHNDEEEDDEDEEEEEEEESGRLRSAKAKLRKRTISPSRGRPRTARKRWSRKPKPSRVRHAQANAELEKQREILRQLPGWVEEDGSTSDSSDEETNKRCVQPQTVLGLRCEWAACGLCFETPAQVFSHVFMSHFSGRVPTSRSCLWDECKEGKSKEEGSADSAEVQRGLYSLLAHICERHCSKAALTASLQHRREAALRGTSLPAKVPPPDEEEASAAVETSGSGGGVSMAAMSCLMRFQHDTYARQAAMDSDSRGPVTRHVRLTAALVLRNLAHHCPTIVKRHIGSYESHLAQLALSNLDSSKVISHILSALDEDDGPLEEEMDLHYHGPISSVRRL